MHEIKQTSFWKIFFLLQILSKYHFFYKRSVTGVVSYVFLSYSLRLGARSQKNDPFAHAQRLTPDLSDRGRECDSRKIKERRN